MKILQDKDKAISVLYEVGKWLEKSGKQPSKWWQPQNMNWRFLSKYTEPNEFYVAVMRGIPAASMVLQDNQRNQSWESIDKDKKQNAIYVHWLCVSRQFAGTNLSQKLIEVATEFAKEKGFSRLRLDTNAKEKKLMSVYKRLGFHLKGIEQEEDRQTAFYEKKV